MGDLADLNEADLLNDADLQDVADFDPTPVDPSGSTTFDLGDLAAPVATAPPASDFGGFGDFGAPAESAAPVADVAAPTDFGTPIAEPVTSDFGGFGAPSGEASSSSLGDFGAASSNVSSFENNFESTPVSQDEGPLGKYEREHHQVLQAKEEESAKRKQREIEEAKKDIAEYFEERKKRTDRNREKHRAANNASQSTPYDEANPWANISSLVDLDKLPNKEYKDVSRMREVLKEVACK
eukprot:CAMPEP_0201523644 /NCGR_PEP_ID=MMETSP0161_2-20130828/20677_1 /ASSEMBLY_ACC=CAM_ASM_000251 /TAXON_ID=180227 /ORGANISM="Neoparamoeba aestuarina, Strain SoJaBio B1-5/56/2" /LENGTH=238 /DNA_ID=CAMNT_0047922829 /DNA_START=52 /DNA_END=768 /DNA_ORIENTATION=+